MEKLKVRNFIHGFPIFRNVGIAIPEFGKSSLHRFLGKSESRKMGFFPFLENQKIGKSENVFATLLRKIRKSEHVFAWLIWKIGKYICTTLENQKNRKCICTTLWKIRKCISVTLENQKIGKCICATLWEIRKWENVLALLLGKSENGKMYLRYS